MTGVQTCALPISGVYFCVLFLLPLYPVVEDNHSLMGGSADALHLEWGPLFCGFFLFLCGASFVGLFLGLECVRVFFYTNPLGACTGGRDMNVETLMCNLFLLAKNPASADRAFAAHHSE